MRLEIRMKGENKMHWYSAWQGAMVLRVHDWGRGWLHSVHFRLNKRIAWGDVVRGPGSEPENGGHSIDLKWRATGSYNHQNMENTEKKCLLERGWRIKGIRHPSYQFSPNTFPFSRFLFLLQLLQLFLEAPYWSLRMLVPRFSLWGPVSSHQPPNKDTTVVIDIYWITGPSEVGHLKKMSYTLLKSIHGSWVGIPEEDHLHGRGVDG